MKPLRLVPLAAAFALAACSAAPTEPALTAGAGPRFDEPNTMGSGNLFDEGGATTQSFGDAAAGDSTNSRGVTMMGSGT